MRRHHFIELHEQPWYPPSLRRIFQESLAAGLVMTRVYENISGPFSRFLHRLGPREVLDLCSGGARLVLDCRARLGPPLDEAERPRFVLSDLFPNPEHYAALKARHPEDLDYYPGPVDARHVPAGAPRVRTMFTALHHFRPAEVRAILADAAIHADGIAIFESTNRTLGNVLENALLLLVAPPVTALLRPLRLRNVLWGLLVPVVPWTLFIDGVVSALRSYTAEELGAIVATIQAPDWKWEIGTADIPMSRRKALYLFGWRRSAELSR